MTGVLLLFEAARRRRRSFVPFLDVISTIGQTVSDAVRTIVAGAANNYIFRIYIYILCMFVFAADDGIDVVDLYTKFFLFRYGLIRIINIEKSVLLPHYFNKIMILDLLINAAYISSKCRSRN